MDVLAVDTGYSATKIYTEVKGSRKTLIFPSVIGPAEFGEDFLGTKEENFIAELSIYPGKVRNFGETAIRLNRGGEMTADRDMFTKHYNPALTLAGIARFMQEKQAFPKFGHGTDHRKHDSNIAIGTRSQECPKLNSE